jgi:hypothetical protein
MAAPTAWPIQFASGAKPGVKRKISKTKTEVETKEKRKKYEKDKRPATYIFQNEALIAKNTKILGSQIQIRTYLTMRHTQNEALQVYCIVCIFPHVTQKYVVLTLSIPRYHLKL